MSTKTKDTWIQIRIDPASKKKYEKIAEKRGLSLSALIRDLLEREAGK